MAPTSTINIVITSDDPAAVEGYVRDAIDNADQDWEVDSATIETEGITVDLLEDEEDLSDEPADEVANRATEEATEEEVEEQGQEQTDPRTEPSGKEF